MRVRPYMSMWVMAGDSGGFAPGHLYPLFNPPNSRDIKQTLQLVPELNRSKSNIFLMIINTKRGPLRG